MVFDPAASLNFHLIHLIADVVEGEGEWEVSVDAYSSETGKWSHQEAKQEQGKIKGLSFMGISIIGKQYGTFVNGMLHVLVMVDNE